MRIIRHIWLIASLSIVSCQSKDSKLELSNSTGIELRLINLLEEKTDQRAKHLRTYYIPLIRSAEGLIHQNYPNHKCVNIPGVYVTINSKKKASILSTN